MFRTPLLSFALLGAVCGNVFGQCAEVDACPPCFNNDNNYSNTIGGTQSGTVVLAVGVTSQTNYQTAPTQAELSNLDAATNDAINNWNSATDSCQVHLPYILSHVSVDQPADILISMFNIKGACAAEYTSGGLNGANPTVYITKPAADSVEANLAQIIGHEIGHALQLANSADTPTCQNNPSSIMAASGDLATCGVYGAGSVTNQDISQANRAYINKSSCTQLDPLSKRLPPPPVSCYDGTAPGFDENNNEWTCQNIDCDGCNADCTNYSPNPGCGDSCPSNNGCSGYDSNGNPIFNPDYCQYQYGCESGWDLQTINTDSGAITCCVADWSPILIDLSGKGFDLTDAAHGVMFDLDGTGKKYRFSWTARDVKNGWLALDRNGDGKIDSGKELFGNYTPQPASADPNGFRALAVYDQPSAGGNGNGAIDPGDAIFGSLLVWIDSNHNGISEPGELFHLKEVGIESISLDYQLSKWSDQYGNVFRYKAKIAIAGLPHDQWTYDVLLLRAR